MLEDLRMKLLSMVFAVAACGSSNQQIGEIHYQVTGGLSGTGDGTSMQIEPGGAVTRQTRAHGQEQGQLPRALLDDIVSKIKDADLPSLEMTYGCSCADDLVDELVVQIDGTGRTVAVSKSSDSAPAELLTALDAVRAAVDAPLQ